MWVRIVVGLGWMAVAGGVFLVVGGVRWRLVGDVGTSVVEVEVVAREGGDPPCQCGGVLVGAEPIVGVAGVAQQGGSGGQ
ncbi:hypothetical protein [Nocardia aurantiaca]|uniref:Uncharacterized protein n=1 Tax=Nocardia aurantiaca TaxID=2675850 RepID=A0A6I3L387_9NOCA|nr:hypothetical protein [Nocardia aurantiaca]MTE16277.1 hypothetical protein [Nocardia aurantiaca]